MGHYFSTQPEATRRRRTVEFQVHGRSYALATAGGVFSADRLDPALDLVVKGRLDAIVFECIGERTLAFGHRDRLADPEAGYNPLLERRLRAVEEKVRAAMDSAWRRTEPSANPLLAQMREQVAEAEERLARARAAGDAKRVAEAESALANKRRVLELAERST